MERMFCIIGLTGSGKSTYLDKLMDDVFKDKDIHRLVYYTTRKPRPNEVDGVDYHFVEHLDDVPPILVIDDKCNVVKNPILIEHRSYNTINNGIVYYYTTLDCVKESIYLCAPSIEQLNSYIDYFGDKRINIIEIYTDIKTRINRIMNKRSCSDDDVYELCRRIVQEKKDWDRAEYSTLLRRHPDIGYIKIDNSDSDMFGSNINTIKDYITNFTNI